MPQDNTVLMEGVRLVFRNFTGKAGKYNQEGQRSFAVVIDNEVGATLSEDGWNVKSFKPREDDEEGEPTECYLPVVLKYRDLRGEPTRPPRVVMVTSRGRTNLDEGSVELLDWANIKNVDLIIRPYPWNVNGKTGITAYLQSMYVTIEEDALEQKYADLDQA